VLKDREHGCQGVQVEVSVLVLSALGGMLHLGGASFGGILGQGRAGWVSEKIKEKKRIYSSFLYFGDLEWSMLYGD